MFVRMMLQFWDFGFYDCYLVGGLRVMGHAGLLFRFVWQVTLLFMLVVEGLFGIGQGLRFSVSR